MLILRAKKVVMTMADGREICVRRLTRGCLGVDAPGDVRVEKSDKADQEPDDGDAKERE